MSVKRKKDRLWLRWQHERARDKSDTWSISLLRRPLRSALKLRLRYGVTHLLDMCLNR